MMLTEHEVVVEAARRFAPDLVIELGTYRGDLAEALGKGLPTVPILTVDCTDEHLTRQSFWPQTVRFCHADGLRPCAGLVAMICCRLPASRLFLYCDDGDKEREVQAYAPWLRVGDLLGVHDWGTEVDPEKVLPYLHDFTETYEDLTDQPTVGQPKGCLSRFFLRER